MSKRKNWCIPVADNGTGRWRAKFKAIDVVKILAEDRVTFVTVLMGVTSQHFQEVVTFDLKTKDEAFSLSFSFDEVQKAVANGARFDYPTTLFHQTVLPCYVSGGIPENAVVHGISTGNYGDDWLEVRFELDDVPNRFRDTYPCIYWGEPYECNLRISPLVPTLPAIAGHGSQ